jgi:PEP-CTERM motif
MRTRSFCIALFAITLMAGMLGGTAAAATRLDVPEDSPGYPFYARIEHTDIFHTDDWAAIAFYRNTASVPPDFNLLDFFDFSVWATDTSDQLTVDGFEIWDELPPAHLAPLFTKSWGLGAVPVWFTSWPELQGAVADDDLTITELASLESLRIGSATFYAETLHPTAPPGLGGAQQPHISINAHGYLDDGTQFQFQTVGNGVSLDGSSDTNHIRIQFNEVGAAAAAVPEPSSAALAAMGLAGLVGWALRRRWTRRIGK